MATGQPFIRSVYLQGWLSPNPQCHPSVHINLVSFISFRLSSLSLARISQSSSNTNPQIIVIFWSLHGQVHYIYEIQLPRQMKFNQPAERTNWAALWRPSSHTVAIKSAAASAVVAMVSRLCESRQLFLVLHTREAATAIVRPCVYVVGTMSWDWSLGI